MKINNKKEWQDLMIKILKSEKRDLSEIPFLETITEKAENVHQKRVVQC